MTLTCRASNLKSTITFWPYFHSRSQFLATTKNCHFLRFMMKGCNMRFHPLIQNSSLYFSRLKRVYRTQTLTRTEYHISSQHSHFWVQVSSGSPFLSSNKIGKFLRFFIIILIRSFLFQFSRDFSTLSKQILTKFISISSYSPEVHAFGLLLHLLKYLGLKSAKLFDHTPKQPFT